MMRFMKKYALLFVLPLIALIILIAALVIGQSARYPEIADDGAAWDKGWEMLGTVLGVDAPEGLKLVNNDTVLAGEDTYYASWALGEPSEYTNSDGKQVELYEAQIYLLLYGCADADAAREALAEWMDRERSTYAVAEEWTEARNGLEFSMLRYGVTSEDNPYDRGASAFAVFGNYVISAEAACTAAHEGEPQALLRDFLDGCHYSTAALKH